MRKLVQTARVERPHINGPTAPHRLAAIYIHFFIASNPLLLNFRDGRWARRCRGTAARRRSICALLFGKDRVLLLIPPMSAAPRPANGRRPPPSSPHLGLFPH
jgi:hypothetical protein